MRCFAARFVLLNALALCVVPSSLAAAPVTLENEHLLLTLDRDSGGFSVLDKAARVRWIPYTVRQRLLRGGEAPTRNVIRGLKRLAKPHAGLQFQTDVAAGGGRKLAVTITVR